MPCSDGGPTQEELNEGRFAPRAKKLRSYLEQLLKHNPALRDTQIKEFHDPIYRVLSSVDTMLRTKKIKSERLCDVYAQCLCGALSNMEENKHDMSVIHTIATDSLGTWWAEHKAHDKARRQQLRDRIAKQKADIAKLEKELADEGG